MDHIADCRACRALLPLSALCNPHRRVIGDANVPLFFRLLRMQVAEGGSSNKQAVARLDRMVEDGTFARIVADVAAVA